MSQSASHHPSPTVRPRLKLRAIGHRVWLTDAIVMTAIVTCSRTILIGLGTAPRMFDSRLRPWSLRLVLSD